MLPDLMCADIIWFHHLELGHLPGHKLFRGLKSLYFNPRLRSISNQIQKNCLDCLAVRHIKPEPSQGPEVPDVEEVPMTKVYADLIDLGGSDRLDMKFALTYVDQTTRYLDAVPLKNKSANEIIRAFSTLFLRYGFPNRLVHDNGLEFVNASVQAFLDDFGIYTSKISPYRPQGNLVERCHRPLGELLKIFEIPIEKWSENLPLIIYFYNISPLGVLSDKSPFECFFLRSPRSALEVNQKRKLGSWLEFMGENASLIFENIAKKHIMRFNLNNVRDSEQPKTLKRNQKVLIFKPTKKGESKKLTRKWIGPFFVVKRTNPDVYLLKHVYTQKRFKRHISHLRVIQENIPKPDKFSGDANLDPSRSILGPQNLQKHLAPDPETNSQNEISESQSIAATRDENSEAENSVSSPIQSELARPAGRGRRGASQLTRWRQRRRRDSAREPNSSQPNVGGEPSSTPKDSPQAQNQTRRPQRSRNLPQRYR